MDPLVLPLIAALAVTILSKLPVSKAQAQADGGYDNDDPRGQQAALTGWGARAVAAHQNAYENFPIYGIAVVACLAQGVEGTTAVAAAWTYVGARVAYNVLYVAGQGSLRSAAWAVGLIATLTLYGLALVA